jgi:hypothetical protein
MPPTAGVAGNTLLYRRPGKVIQRLSGYVIYNFNRGASQGTCVDKDKLIADRVGLVGEAILKEYR